MRPTLDDIMNDRTQTRKGQCVTIYAHDLRLTRPIVGRIEGRDFVDQWHEDGIYSQEREFMRIDDLVLKPEFEERGE